MGTATPTQLRMLRLIREHIDANGFPPSHRDLMDAGGWNSTSTVHQHLSALRGLGYITWRDGQTRTIRILNREEP